VSCSSHLVETRGSCALAKEGGDHRRLRSRHLGVRRDRSDERSTNNHSGNRAIALDNMRGFACHRSSQKAQHMRTHDQRGCCAPPHPCLRRNRRGTLLSGSKRCTFLVVTPEHQLCAPRRPAQHRIEPRAGKGRLLLVGSNALFDGCLLFTMPILQGTPRCARRYRPRPVEGHCQQE